MEISNNKLELKPYSKTELARIYGISLRCLNNWLDKFKSEIGEKRGRYFNINQVRVIIEKLGLPGTIGEPKEESSKKSNTAQKK